MARAIYKNSIGIYSCKNCCYNKHIEVCHIKPLKDFSKDSVMADINHPDNLVGLCRNCHWEFDNGLLVL